MIKPKKIIDEIDTIGKAQKAGAYNELNKIKEFKDQGVIDTALIDYEITDPYDADSKLYNMMAINNSATLITADKNIANNAHADGAFVIQIINYIPQGTTSNIS